MSMKVFKSLFKEQVQYKPEQNRLKTKAFTKLFQFQLRKILTLSKYNIRRLSELWIITINVIIEGQLNSESSYTVFCLVHLRLEFLSNQYFVFL